MERPEIIDLAPHLEKICKELEKDIKRGGPIAIRCSDETAAKLYDYYVRKLLKSRVKRIRIDT